MRKKCQTCDGSGKVVNPKYKDVIFFLPPDDYEVDCPDCAGTGKRLRTKGA